MNVTPIFARNINKPEGSIFNTMNEPWKILFHIEPVTAQEINNIVYNKSSKTSMDYLDVLNFKLIKETIADTSNHTYN